MNTNGTKYGIRKDANIGELVNSILRKINSGVSGSGRNTSDKGQQKGAGGEAKTLPGRSRERRTLDVRCTYRTYAVKKDAAERVRSCIFAGEKSLQKTDYRE